MSLPKLFLRSVPVFLVAGAVFAWAAAPRASAASLASLTPAFLGSSAAAPCPNERCKSRSSCEDKTSYGCLISYEGTQPTCKSVMCDTAQVPPVPVGG